MYIRRHFLQEAQSIYAKQPSKYGEASDARCFVIFLIQNRSKFRGNNHQSSTTESSSWRWQRPMWGTLKHALSTIIYYKIACTSWRVHLSCFSLPLLSAKLSAKQIPHQSLVLKDKVEHCCKEFSLRDISTTLWDISSLRAVSSKTKLNSQRD